MDNELVVLSKSVHIGIGLQSILRLVKLSLVLHLAFLHSKTACRESIKKAKKLRNPFFLNQILIYFYGDLLTFLLAK